MLCIGIFEHRGDRMDLRQWISYDLVLALLLTFCIILVKSVLTSWRVVEILQSGGNPDQTTIGRYIQNK
jgi:hypothetical protein